MTTPPIPAVIVPETGQAREDALNTLWLAIGTAGVLVGVGGIILMIYRKDRGGR